jgi:hypothetical protein
MSDKKAVLVVGLGEVGKPLLANLSERSILPPLTKPPDTSSLPGSGRGSFHLRKRLSWAN